MDPVIAAEAVSSRVSAGEAAPTVETNVTVPFLGEGAEVASEAREAILGELGLLEQLDTIQYSSLEAVTARNEAAVGEVWQIEENHEEGTAREDNVREELMKEYPAEDGFRIESQVPLRDEGGAIVKDPETGEGRRLDFVVIKDGEVIGSVEVTSETADKSMQTAKEDRIRDAGGNYVTDRTTGELVPFAPGVQTEVIRRP